VERPSEARLRISNDRSKPVVTNIALGMLNLIGTGEGVVDAPAQLGPGARGVKALIRKHCACRVVICGHLPAREITALQACSDHLHGLIPRRCTERGNEWLIVKQSPEPVRSDLGEGVLNVKRAAQSMYFLRRVGSVDPRKALLRSRWYEVFER